MAKGKKGTAPKKSVMRKIGGRSRRTYLTSNNKRFYYATAKSGKNKGKRRRVYIPK